MGIYHYFDILNNCNIVFVATVRLQSRPYHVTISHMTYKMHTYIRLLININITTVWKAKLSNQLPKVNRSVFILQNIGPQLVYDSVIKIKPHP